MGCPAISPGRRGDTMIYEILWGAVERGRNDIEYAPTLECALERARAAYPHAYVETDGGVSLVWPDVDTSEDDPGARAVARITGIAGVEL